jgi:hypothetical protein
MTKNVTEVKLGGAKRKNGHKSDCTCHICENIKNKAKRGGYEEEAEKEAENQLGGSKKKNGHRKNCDCPICKNMKNSKKGGKEDSLSDEDEKENFTKESKNPNGHKANCHCPMCNSITKINEDEDVSGGKKKKNNHKLNCKCPICKNMRNKKRGGDDTDIENQMGDIEEGGIKADASLTNDETPASPDEYNALDNAERGEAGTNVVGGASKRKRNKMSSKSKRARRTRKRNRTRRHH